MLCLTDLFIMLFGRIDIQKVSIVTRLRTPLSHATLRATRGIGQRAARTITSRTTPGVSHIKREASTNEDPHDVGDKGRRGLS